MGKILLSLGLGLFLAGCGTRPLAIQAVTAPANDQASGDTAKPQGQPVILKAVSPASLVGPTGISAITPAGIPDLAGVRLEVSPSGTLTLITADDKHWPARTHVEGDRVMFGVDLPEGGNLAGVLKVTRQTPYVVAWVITDAGGQVYAGRQSFQAAGQACDCTTCVHCTCDTATCRCKAKEPQPATGPVVSPKALEAAFSGTVTDL